MDADVEMVKRDRDEAGPAEDLYVTSTLSPIESRFFRQNRCFTASVVVGLAVLFFFLTTYYQKQVERPMDNPSDRPLEEGELVEGIDNSIVASGVTKIHQTHLKKHTSLHNNTHDSNKHSSTSTGGDSTFGSGSSSARGPSHGTGSQSQTLPTASPVATATDTPVSTPTQKNKIPAAGNSSSTDVHAWLDSPVCIEDGVKFEVVQELHHDKKSFTEGLAFVNGVLYESVGMFGQSALLVVDPKTGDTLQRYDMESKFFAEGLAHVNGKLIQLTYKSNTGFIYNIKNLTEAPKRFEFHSTTNEGWGLTYDQKNNELIMSDGSEFLHFWDADTLKEKRKVSVTRMNGKRADDINELEFWRGRVIANVWYRDFILVINPETGIVEKEYGAFRFCC